MPLSAGDRLGVYEVTAEIGAGGMGIVYRARDTKLERNVALKVLPDLFADDPERLARFQREAKVLASLNHPNICTLHDIGCHDGLDFLVMEYLEGETLADRLARAPLPVPLAIQHALVLLAALGALHRAGLVHRDLKPHNLFVTAHGLKLLDFGLARPVPVHRETDPTALTVALPGMSGGTPQYMAPETLQGQPADARSDLFAVGAVLYEMLSGKAAFPGTSLIDIAHAVVHETPPVLMGSAVIAAVDRVIHRALAKRPEDRHQTAENMAQALREVLATSSEVGDAVKARPATRLIVLPFRLLRLDPDSEFLAFSLPDAITTSLSGLRSLVVRSSLAAGKFASPTPDLKAIAQEAEVDAVLLGTLLRSGDQLRVNTQLLEVPAGTVLWSQSSQVAWQDIFQLQDELTHRIVESLSLPLTAREHHLLSRDAPASPTAYEHCLRANQLSERPTNWMLARDLYQRCVEQDPSYAPAWAHLGRMHQVVAKMAEESELEGYSRAEAAFKRALELNPDLPLAHNLYAGLEVEQGHAQDAMLRLIDRAWTGGADPVLFSGLVYACRYCGLLDASMAAHEQARRLDPRIKTSVAHTLTWAGHYQEAIDESHDVTEAWTKSQCLLMLRREGEAIRVIDAAIGSGDFEKMRGMLTVLSALRALAQGDREAPLRAVRKFLKKTRDPEVRFELARHLAHFGEPEEAVSWLEKAVTHGFFCFPAMTRDPWLDPVRTAPEFVRLLQLAEFRYHQAVSAFTQAGGHRVLGLPI